MDIIQFSGGKDSQAVIHWYQENINKPDAIIVFCDTGHESKKTYQHIKYIKSNVPYPFIVLKSKKYKDLFDLSEKKGRFPSSQTRFCTTELKVIPFIDFILDLNCNVDIYQGIRHEESNNRSKMNRTDDYFGSYYGKELKNLHNKKQVLRWCEKYDAKVIRPIITWSTKEVFEFITKSGFKRNPLYDMGCSRVGCFPCIMARKGEVFNMLHTEEGKQIFKKIAKFEEENNTTFFPPNYLPERAKTKEVITKKGKTVKISTVEDVIRYVKGKNLTGDLFSGSCRNGFVQCE